MSCPICDNKPANCDCSSDAIRLHEENAELTQKLESAQRERDVAMSQNATMNNQINVMHLQVCELRKLMERAKTYTVRILADQGVPAESWGMLAWQRDIDAGISGKCDGSGPCDDGHVCGEGAEKRKDEIVECSRCKVNLLGKQEREVGMCGHCQYPCPDCYSKRF